MFIAHTKFQQAVISPSLPKHFEVFELANKNQLPQAVRSQVKDKLHVWIVTSGQWSHIGLPQRGIHADGLFHNLISIFSKLQHPLKVSSSLRCLYSYNCFRIRKEVCLISKHI